MKRRTDTVTVAAVSCQYDNQKPGAKHTVTLSKIARRNGLCVYQLWNFRRGLRKVSK